MGLIEIRSRIQEIASKTFPELYTGSESVGTGGTQFSSQAVPKGSKVLVRADPGNGDYVNIGGSTEGSLDFKLTAGGSLNLAVSDVSEIEAEANSGTQTVQWIVEGE